MLASYHYARHFDAAGRKDTHFGLLPCRSYEQSTASSTNGVASCC